MVIRVARGTPEESAVGRLPAPPCSSPKSSKTVANHLMLASRERRLLQIILWGLRQA